MTLSDFESDAPSTEGFCGRTSALRRGLDGSRGLGGIKRNVSRSDLGSTHLIKDSEVQVVRKPRDVDMDMRKTDLRSVMVDNKVPRICRFMP